MKIREIMTRDVQTVRPDDSIRRAAQLMDQLNVGILPVCDGRDLVGVVTDRDITVRAISAGKQPDRCKVSEVMTANPRYCYEDDPVGSVTELMAGQPDYEVILEETHHTQKKDAPSGTAITLAEQVLEKLDRKKQWVNDLSDRPEDLEIISQRIDPAPGTHSVKYSSAVDTIEITHTAHNRKGFASGAVLAAEFLKGKTGLYSMKEALGIE